MKFDLSTLTVSIGFTLGAIAYANVVEARFVLNGSSLTGQILPTTTLEQPRQVSFNGSSLDSSNTEYK